jgi:hypothetical protein
MTGKPRLRDARYQRFGMVRSLGRDNLASETVHRRAPLMPPSGMQRPITTM